MRGLEDDPELPMRSPTGVGSSCPVEVLEILIEVLVSSGLVTIPGLLGGGLIDEPDAQPSLQDLVAIVHQQDGGAVESQAVPRRDAGEHRVEDDLQLLGTLSEVADLLRRVEGVDHSALGGDQASGSDRQGHVVASRLRHSFARSSSMSRSFRPHATSTPALSPASVTGTATA